MGARKRLRATRTSRRVSRQIASGVAAGPLFIAAFTAIGARTAGYDWRRHAVSSLTNGRAGWLQRANFVLAGSLYSRAAAGLARSGAPSPIAGPRAVSALAGAAGVGLIGSGVFVTDPVGGFPPGSRGDIAHAEATRGSPRTRAGDLHNLCAIPIFVGIPAAALACAGSAVRAGKHGWAAYSAASALLMAGSFVLMGAAFAGEPCLAGHAGTYQRISIISGFGWLSALSARALAWHDRS